MLAARTAVHPVVADALSDCRRAFASVALFSGVVDLLMLAGPLYMLQIYDRVLSSRSVPTLVALSLFLVGAYAFQGILDLIRSRVVVRSAALLDQRLALAVHGAVIRLAVATSHLTEAPQPVRDLDQIRAFLTGAGPIAIVDLPWIPLFSASSFIPGTIAENIARMSAAYRAPTTWWWRPRSLPRTSIRSPSGRRRS
jgi:ABC-type protease/lipase transport system fused ATPase/permease subunit